MCTVYKNALFTIAASPQHPDRQVYSQKPTLIFIHPVPFRNISLPQRIDSQSISHQLLRVTGMQSSHTSPADLFTTARGFYRKNYFLMLHWYLQLKECFGLALTPRLLLRILRVRGINNCFDIYKIVSCVLPLPPFFLANPYSRQSEKKSRRQNIPTTNI